MATQAFTPAQLASNIAFQTAKKASPKVSTTPAPLQSLLKPQLQQSQAISTNNIPGVGLSQVNNPIKTAVKTPKTPAVLPATGSGKKSLSEFGETIKAKYPQYANVDSTELGKKMLEKYPQYADMVDTPNAAQNIAGGVVQSSIGLPQLGAKLINPVFNALDKYVIDPISKKLGADPNKVAQNTAQAQQARQGLMKGAETFGQQVTGGDPESTAFKGAKLVGDIAQTAILPGPGGLKAGAGFIKGVGQLAKQGAIETAKFTAISEKRLPTPKELAYGVGGNIILGGGIQGLQKLASKTKGAGNKIAEGMVGSNLKNPAMREKYIAKVGQTPEKTLLDEGIVGSLSDQAKQVSEKSSTAYNATRETLKSIPTKVKSDEGLWITNKILEGVDETIPGIDEVLAPIKDMNQRFANGSASLSDLNDAKLMLARYENIYDQFGKVKKSGDEFEKKALAKMYNKMKTELEKIGETYGVDLKSMNKETQKREGLRALMDRAVAREAGRDMIGLSDYILGGLTISDPMTAIPLALGKKFFSSPKVSSRIAKFLYSKGKDVASNTSNTNMSVVDGATRKGVNALPLKKAPASPVTPGGLVKQSLVNQPKPTVKTPIIIREIQGLAKNPGTTKVGLPVPKKEVVPVKPKVDTFNKMIELDTNPQYQKQTPQDTNYKRNAKGLQTEYGTIESVKYDSKYNPQEFTIDGVKYPAGEVNNFWKKIGLDELKSNALINKNGEIRNKLRAIRNGKENKVSGPQLRIVMEDLGLKSIDDIPDESLQTILDLSRKQTVLKVTPKATTNTTPTPKANETKPKVGLGKEMLEQAGDNIKLFGDFKDIDVGSKNEVFSRFESEGMKQKLSSGISRATADKMSMLDTQLRRYGHKGVNNSDFGSMYKLSDIYDNTEFFAKYPSLKDVNVIFADFRTPSKRGMTVGNDIYINSKLYSKDPDLLRSTIVHEIQHMKQDIRGLVGRNSEVDERILSKGYAEDAREIDAKRKQDSYMEYIKNKKLLLLKKK